MVVPRVEEAIISRVTAKRSTSSTSSSSSPRPSPSNCGLSAGQQAVVKAALSILVNKAVLMGCPLPRHGVWASQTMERIHSHVSPAVVSAVCCKIKKKSHNILMCFPFLHLLQRSTDTCWSFVAGPSLCRPSAPIKEVVVEEVERDATVAS